MKKRVLKRQTPDDEQQPSMDSKEEKGEAGKQTPKKGKKGKKGKGELLFFFGFFFWLI